MLVTKSLQWMLTMLCCFLKLFSVPFFVFVFYAVTLAIFVQAIGKLHMFKVLFLLLQ